MENTGFSLWNWIKGQNKNAKRGAPHESDWERSCTQLQQDIFVQELAFNCAVNLVANAVSKCEFKTYKNHKAIKEDEYWRWNIKPNTNENSSEFLHKLISKLFCKNEVLVIERVGKLLIADSYEKTSNVIHEDIFSEIYVKDLKINKHFRRSEVIFLRLNNENMKNLLDRLNASYSKLLSSAQKGYKWKNGNHFKQKITAFENGAPDWMEKVQEMQKNTLRPFLESENGVYAEFNGYELEEFGESGNRSSQNTRDIKALIDDVFEIAAKAVGVPAALVKGDVQGTKDAVQNLLTFCIDPLCDQIQEEINAQVYGFENFSQGNYLKIDTTAMEHFDWFSNAANVEKLISSGAKSIDDVLVMAGETPLNTPWSRQHFITKNFSTIDDLIKLGGENN